MKAFMYIFYLAAVIAYFTVITIIGAREIKKLLNVTITEELRIKNYIESMLFGWGAVLVVLVMCLFAGISFSDVGFRQISFEYNIWFTVITFILCGALLAVLLYQTISCFVSAKFREEVKAKLTNNAGKGHYDALMENLMLPRSKKEKRMFFWMSLEAGIGEEIILRGFLYFLLQAVFPGISIILVVVAASAFFGICHAYQGLQGVIKTTAAGALFGCLFLVTGSLIPGMLLHFFADYSSAFLLSEENEQ